MKFNNDMIAIRVTDNCTLERANDIMDIYCNNALENKGVTWYSTNVIISKEQDPPKAILFHNKKNCEFYYMVDILEIRNFENEEIIAEREIPEVYKDVPKKTWIRINNIKKIDVDDLKKYYTRDKDELLFDKLTKNKNKQNFPRMFFYKLEEEI